MNLKIGGSNRLLEFLRRPAKISVPYFLCSFLSCCINNPLTIYSEENDITFQFLLLRSTDY